MPRILIAAGSIGLLLAGWLYFRNMDMDENQDLKVLKVAFPADRAVTEYEPTRIVVDNEYIFLESIYSPLVELSDDKGAPVASVAKEHYWSGDELHFVIRDDLSTIDGVSITAEDAAISLKRVLILSGNTHGDFKSMICPNSVLKSVEDECPGIAVSGNKLILKPVAKRDFLVPMLSAIDFAIIPKSSLDPKSLKIIDYRNTSGPYYVDKDLGGGNVILKLNSNHYLASSRNAEEIRLVPTKGLPKSEIVKRLKNGDIDFISTIEGLDIGDLSELSKDQFEIHETMKIKVKMAYATERGVQELSREQRLSFAKGLQRGFHDRYNDHDVYGATSEFFLGFSDGGLSKSQSEKISQMLNGVEDQASDEEIRLDLFHLRPDMYDEFEKIIMAEVPSVKLAPTKKLPAFNKDRGDQQPHFILLSTDSSFSESISLLSYMISADAFGQGKKAGRKWLEDYMSTENKSERVRKVQDLHFDSLADGRLIPLVNHSYVAVAKSPWKPELSELFANCPLWKIRR